jgi:beta-lactamase regulating signal transducer with metallopeptidase domain
MENLFLNIINTSITASIIILFVLALRFLFRKSTKKFSYVLWLILLIRLIVPFSFETQFNPMPDKFAEFSNRAYIGDIEESKETIPGLEMGTEESINPNNQIIKKPVKSRKININEKKFSMKNSLPYIWIMGIVLFLIHGIISNQQLKKSLKGSNYLYENLYENENLNTAFIHGIIQPKIYIPNHLDEKEREYIIIHEKTHLKRYDHIIKFLYYIALSIHWFNPLIWLAFILMGRDMELSCDEDVMKEIGNHAKKDYCKTLLSLATGHKMKIVTPLSFSENNTKGRVKNVLDYKKPKFWVSLILIIVVIVLAFFIFTKPKINGEDVIGEVEDDEYGIYNKTFKDPRDAAEIIFNKELEKVKEYTHENAKIEEARITNFKSRYTYEGYLDSNIEVFDFEYIIRGKELLDYPFMNISGDGVLTEADIMGGWKPMLAFLNKGSKYEFLGFIFSGEFYSDTKAEIEIGLNELLESKDLKGPEIFSGDHIIAEYEQRGGGTYKILLSQPAKTGEDGIWCVDRWMDENGNLYYNVIQSDLSLKEYYAEIQEKVDNGEDQKLLDGKEVAINFVKEYLNRDFAKAYSFEFYENASIDDFLIYPINQYYGYIMELKEYDWTDDYTIHFDKLEFLHNVHPKDVERLKELNIDPEKLENGFYIYNPTSYPHSFTIDEDTEFYIIDDSTAQSIKVDEETFVEHYNKNKDALFMLEDENFKLKKVMQHYLP